MSPHTEMCFGVCKLYITKVDLALIQTNAFSLLVGRHMKERDRVGGELAIVCSVMLYSKQVTTQSMD